MVTTADTPAGMIARLEDALDRRGQSVTLSKIGDSPATSGMIKAHVRAVKEDEIVGPVQQTWSKVILSPTGLGVFLPLRKGDKCTIDGRPRQIEFYQPIKSADTLVRIELMVAG